MDRLLSVRSTRRSLRTVANGDGRTRRGPDHTQQPPGSADRRSRRALSRCKKFRRRVLANSRNLAPRAAFATTITMLTVFPPAHAMVSPLVVPDRYYAPLPRPATTRELAAVARLRCLDVQMAEGSEVAATDAAAIARSERPRYAKGGVSHRVSIFIP